MNAKVAILRKLRTIVLALAAPALVVSAVTIVYTYRHSKAFTPLIRRGVTEPGPEDYAAYSAFVDDLFSSDQLLRADQKSDNRSIVYIQRTTLKMQSPGSVIPLEAASLGSVDVGEDFFRKNSRSWNLEPRLFPKRKVLLVSEEKVKRATGIGIADLYTQGTKEDERKRLLHPRSEGPFPEDRSASGILQLSRLGFDRRGSVALLYYNYRCGALCGQSGWVALRKTQGDWQIAQFGKGVVY